MKPSVLTQNNDWNVILTENLVASNCGFALKTLGFFPMSHFELLEDYCRISVRKTFCCCGFYIVVDVSEQMSGKLNILLPCLEMVRK